MAAGSALVRQATLFRSSQSATVGALTLQICDWLASIVEERNFFWKITVAKIAYIWCRYFFMAAQIASIVFQHRIQQKPLSHQDNLCAIYYSFKSTVGQIMVSSFEGILMVRVYALYGGTRQAGLFLLAVFLFDYGLHTYANALSVRSLISESSCLEPPVSPRKVLILFGTSATFGQSVIFFMTVGRYCVGAQEGWVRISPLVSRMLRDGAFVYMSVFGLIASLTVFEFLRTVVDYEDLLGILFAWYVGAMSIAGCHLILCIRRLAERHNNNGVNNCDSFCSDIILTDISPASVPNERPWNLVVRNLSPSQLPVTPNPLDNLCPPPSLTRRFTHSE